MIRAGLSVDDIVEACNFFSRDWFYRNRLRLEAAGFPKRDPLTRRYDPIAIEAWQDARVVEALPPSKRDEIDLRELDLRAGYVGGDA